MAHAGYWVLCWHGGMNVNVNVKVNAYPCYTGYAGCSTG